MREIIDISPAISERLAVFPSDVAFTRDVSFDMNRGDHLTLSSFSATCHVGAHADAPSHYLRDGEDIASRALDSYIGECLVAEPVEGEARSLEPQDFPRLPEELPDRILVKSGSFPDPNRWTNEFSSLTPELIDALAERGVRLIGTDCPSIDPAESKALDAHRAAGRHDISILEGLHLEHVEPGRYELIALPLRIEGGDGAPVRAVLRTLQ